jgi:hypothetical protein
MLNLEMSLKPVLHSLMQLEAHRDVAICDTIISRKGTKTFNQNQINNEGVEDLLHQNAVLSFIDQRKGRKCVSNGLEPQ